jgi:hypothetical protein
VLRVQDMLRATLAWRAEYKPELITAEDIESEAEQGKVLIERVRRRQRGLRIPGQTNLA